MQRVNILNFPPSEDVELEQKIGDLGDKRTRKSKKGTSKYPVDILLSSRHQAGH